MTKGMHPYVEVFHLTEVTVQDRSQQLCFQKKLRLIIHYPDPWQT
jgi:hypothetical protein